MTRSGWLGVLWLIASCRAEPPPPECPPSASVQPHVFLPLPIGAQSLMTVTSAAPGQVETSLRLLRSDGGLAAESPPTLERQFVWNFETPDADRYLLAVKATCAGRVLEEAAWVYSVYERLVLDRSLPRSCARLTRLSSDLLECDGVVVTVDGGLAPGFRQSANGNTRPVLRDGGFVRWLREADVLRREADGELLELPVITGAEWLASGDFAVLGDDTLVFRADAGLVAVPLDADLAADETLCAAEGAGATRTVLRCSEPNVIFFDTYNGPGHLSACSIDVGPALAGLSGCVDVRGMFVRQEPSSRHVLSVDAALWSGPLLSNRVQVPYEYQSGYFDGLELDDLQYGLSPLLFGGRDGYLVLTNEASQRWLFTTELRASADLAWRSDGGSTEWTVLP